MRAAVARGRKPAWSRALVVDCRSLSRALGTLATQKVEGSSPFIRLAFKPIPSNTGCARQALEASERAPRDRGSMGNVARTGTRSTSLLPPDPPSPRRDSASSSGALAAT